MIVILGPTACGKTKLAIAVANEISGEIISADSRQVYRRMNIGTGKDLTEYEPGNNTIKYHLIDIVEPGYEYNLFQFQQDFHKAHQQIKKNGNRTILCGGTGLYLSAILDGYQLADVPINNELRISLDNLTKDELVEQLKSYGPLHNSTNITSHKRLVRAIEIAFYSKNNNVIKNTFPPIPAKIFGINIPRDALKDRITKRLKLRLEEGMIDEVKSLLNEGLTEEQLKYYGLEYKFITQYIKGDINKNELFQKLNTAIHQFSKRQMTWFRKMERDGHKIQWLDFDPDPKYLLPAILKRT